MLVAFKPGDRKLVALGIPAGKRKCDTAAKALAALNLPTLHVDARKAALESVETKLGPLLAEHDYIEAGEWELHAHECEALRCGMHVVLGELSGMRDDQVAFDLSGAIFETDRKIVAAQALSDRLGGQDSLGLDDSVAAERTMLVDTVAPEGRSAVRTIVAEVARTLSSSKEPTPKRRGKTTSSRSPLSLRAARRSQPYIDGKDAAAGAEREP